MSEASRNAIIVAAIAVAEVAPRPGDGWNWSPELGDALGDLVAAVGGNNRPAAPKLAYGALVVAAGRRGTVFDVSHVTRGRVAVLFPGAANVVWFNPADVEVVS